MDAKPLLVKVANQNQTETNLKLASADVPIHASRHTRDRGA